MTESEYNTILSVMVHEVDILRFQLETVREEKARLENELKLHAMKKEVDG